MVVLLLIPKLPPPWFMKTTTTALAGFAMVSSTNVAQPIAVQVGRGQAARVVPRSIDGRGSGNVPFTSWLNCTCTNLSSPVMRSTNPS